MDRAIKVLAWYTAILVFLDIIVTVAIIGQPAETVTPLVAVLTIILSAPIVALAILVLIRMRRRD